MELRALGATDVKVSRIGLGGFELGGADANAGDPTTAEALEVVEAALEGGINWLDTSEAYLATRNETQIGEVLQQINRDILVATKLYPAPGGTGFRREQVHAAAGPA